MWTVCCSDFKAKEELEYIFPAAVHTRRQRVDIIYVQGLTERFANISNKKLSVFSASWRDEDELPLQNLYNIFVARIRVCF